MHAAAGLAAILAMITASGPTEAAPATQKQCKGPITTFGQHKGVSKARQIALNAWVDQVTAAHGASWTDVHKAKVQMNDCTKIAGGWSCQFRAQPCIITGTLGEHAPGTKPARPVPLGARRVD